MIKHFDDFLKKVKDSNFTFAAENLNEFEQTILEAHVMTWTSAELEPAVDVLADYFNIHVPESLLRKVLRNNLDLASEVYDNSVNDTCQREKLVDAVLTAIGCRNWPINCEGDEAYKLFCSELSFKLKANGGTFGDE